MRKLTTALLICSLLFTLVLPAVSAAGEAITFDDIRLEAAVRDALNKPNGGITAVDMESLTSLHASGRAIKSLIGIEHAIHLESLVLNQNELTDLTPLRQLSALKSLWLNDNQLTDLSAINSLSQLEYLYAANNHINSMSSITDLPQLKELNVSHNRIEDIAPLQALVHLESLNLEGNGFKRISGMEKLTKLRFLSLANNPVSDLQPISGLSSLLYLNQQGYAITAESSRVLQALSDKGRVVEYSLIIPEGSYIYDVNRDGIADENDILDVINYLKNVNNMKERHPELKIDGNEIDPASFQTSAYIYDINRDGVPDENDMNDMIHFFINQNDMKKKHPEFKVVVTSGKENVK